MPVARLFQSVANIHNVLLVVVIILFLYVSVLPLHKEKIVNIGIAANPTTTAVEPRPVVDEVPISCPATVEHTTCNFPDLSPYDNLVAKYEGLILDFKEMRKAATEKIQAEVEFSYSQAKELETKLHSIVELLRERQIKLAHRIEKVQQRIAVPRNVTQIDEKIIEISGSCPFFHIQSTPEYRQLLTKFDETKISLDILTSQFDQLKHRSMASQEWLLQLSSALPGIVERISTVEQKRVNSLELPSLDSSANKLTALVQNEVHDQWKETKASQETFAELYRISTETFDTITERWQSAIEEQQAAVKIAAASLPKAKKERKPKESPRFTETTSTANEAKSPSTEKEDVMPTIDYALGSTGATIVTKETSETYIPTVSALANNPGILGGLSHGISKTLLGAGPEDAISSLMTRGSCWPMQGSNGHLTVQLSRPIVVNAVTLEHLMNAEDISSAPRTFHVFVKADNSESSSWEKVLGWEEFDASKGKTTFPIQPSYQKLATQVRLEIVENYGHPAYTCIYRFRVHGKPL